MSINMFGYGGMSLPMYQQPGYYTPPAPAVYGNGLPYANGFKNPAYGPAAFEPYLDTGMTNAYGTQPFGGMYNVPQYQTNPNYGFNTGFSGGFSAGFGANFNTGFTGGMYAQNYGTGFPTGMTQPYFNPAYQGAMYPTQNYGMGYGAGQMMPAGGPPMKGQPQQGGIVPGGGQQFPQQGMLDPSLQPGYVLAPGGTPQQPQGVYQNGGYPAQQQMQIVAGGDAVNPNDPLGVQAMYASAGAQGDAAAAGAAAPAPNMTGGAQDPNAMIGTGNPNSLFNGVSTDQLSGASSATPPDPSDMPNGQASTSTGADASAGAPPVPNMDAQTGQQAVAGGGGLPLSGDPTIAQLQQAVAGLTQLTQQLMQLVAQQQGGGIPQGQIPSVFDQTSGPAPYPTGTDGSGVPDSLPPVAAPTPTAPTQAPAPVPAPMPAPAPGDFRGMARAAAQKYGLNPDIFERQIGAESNFDPKAGSPAGAQGIAQIMPGTAAEWGVDPWDPPAALDAAAKNMKKYVDNYGGDYAKALAAYNAGPGAVEKFGGVPPYAETQNYVKKILG